MCLAKPGPRRKISLFCNSAISGQLLHHPASVGSILPSPGSKGQEPFTSLARSSFWPSRSFAPSSPSRTGLAAQLEEAMSQPRLHLERPPRPHSLSAAKQENGASGGQGFFEKTCSVPHRVVPAGPLNKISTGMLCRRQGALPAPVSESIVQASIFSRKRNSAG